MNQKGKRDAAAKPKGRGEKLKIVEETRRKRGEKRRGGFEWS